jgi:hypothetical protein
MDAPQRLSPSDDNNAAISVLQAPVLPQEHCSQSPDLGVLTRRLRTLPVPTVHGFREVFGNHTHLHAEEKRSRIVRATKKIRAAA